MEWVKKGEIDFGILLDNVDLSCFECEEIKEGHYRLYVSKTWRDANPLFLLDSDERIETNLLKKAYRKKYQQELPVLMEISSWEVIANLAEAGLGIGFLPDYVANSRKKSLKRYPLALSPLPYKIYAFFAKEHPRGAHIDAFVDLLRNELH